MSQVKYTESQLFNLIGGSRAGTESVYDIWKSLGYEGDANDFLEFLKAGVHIDTEARAQITQLSEEKISLPKDSEGNIICGTEGEFLVSDGNGGTKCITVSNGNEEAL